MSYEEKIMFVIRQIVIGTCTVVKIKDYLITNREFKLDVYGKRQTAKITSDFLFSSCIT